MHAKISLPFELDTALDKIKRNNKHYVFSVVKWKTEDHIPLFSDFDIRIIVDTLDEYELYKLNLDLAKEFTKFGKKQKFERLLEHPPGKIILLKEIELGLHDSVDTNTWEFIHGNYQAYSRIIKQIKHYDLSPAQQADLQNRLVTRINTYKLKKEPLFKSLNKNQYSKYCLSWHYYAYSLFLYYCLNYKIVKSKTKALAEIKRNNPKLKVYNKKELLQCVYNKNIKIEQLEKNLTDSIQSIIQKKYLKQIKNQIVDFKVLSTYYQFFRAKPCRVHIYKNIKYNSKVVNREINEITTEFKIMHRFLNNKSHNKITRNYLTQLLKYMTPIYSMVQVNNITNNLNSLSKLLIENYKKIEKNYLETINTIFPVGIDSFKIKITPKCTRKCNYCIFHDNSLPEMPLIDFDEILKAGRNFHFNKIFINGGEPTLHSQFSNISKQLKKNYPFKEKIIGTNCTILANSQRIFEDTIRCYDTFLIGCDDEHKNITEIEKVVPELRLLNKQVVINSVKGFISNKTDERINKLCKKTGATHVYNQLHHKPNNKKRNKIISPCNTYWKKTLLVDVNGDCHRCFNAVNKNNPEFSINDPKIGEKLFVLPKKPYTFCYYCDEYDKTPNK